MIEYILSHPIQYQSPLIRYLSKRIKIKVLYRSDISLKNYFDKNFNRKVILDKKLLAGYKSEFIKYIGPNKVSNIFPINIEFIKKIFSKDIKIIWLHGIKNWYNLTIIFLNFFFKKKIFVRDEINYLTKRSLFNKVFNRIFFLIIDSFIDAYLYIGTENKQAYLINKINRQKLFHVPYAIDNDSFKTKKRKTNKIEIIFIGKLIDRKGCDILLKAIKICNEFYQFKKIVKINIIGDGIYLNQYKEYKIKNNLNNVKFLGFKNQTQIKKYLKKTNILIVPSREENWGLVVNEGMASGNIIIGSNRLGCAKDLIFNNVNGFIHKNNNSRDLSKKILYLFKNRNKISFLSKNSSKIIEKNSFKFCYKGINKAINYVKKKN